MNPSGQISDGTGPGDRAHVTFQGQEVFQLADKATGGTPRARSFPFTKQLNRIWRSGRMPAFRAEREGSGARITADGETILRILAGDAPDPLGAATEISTRIAAEFAARARGQR